MAPTITTSLETLSTTRALVAAANPRRDTIYFHNENASIGVRVGGSDVTAAATPATAGHLAQSGPGDPVPFIGNAAKAAWYAIAESGTPNLQVTQVID